jgi:hypothetical protein
MDNRNNYCFFLKKRLIKYFLIGFMFLSSATPHEAQSGLIPEKYLRIIPGVSTRADVERLFSKRDPKSHFVDYDTSDLLVGIQYSLGPCELKQGVWGFPEWMVEQVYINWPEGKTIRLHDIILKPKRFEKRQIGDVTVDDYYVNDEFGIIVVYDRRRKEVSSLGLKPSAKFIDKYACQKE